MQLTRFRIDGLFGVFDHRIDFPLPTTEGAHPALLILHGRNGIGKTTILRMLDGMMRLDFNMFRVVPFRDCVLEFTPTCALVVKRAGTDQVEHLDVEFKGVHARLHPRQPGSLDEKDSPVVLEFRRVFLEATEDIAFEFIHTERLTQRGAPIDVLREEARLLGTIAGSREIATGVPNPKAKPSREPGTLASRVQRFIREAQVNYRTFFATTEPDLFPRIIERLTSTVETTYTISDLAQRLEQIRDQDKETRRLGLEPDYWDFDQLTAPLQALGRKQGTARDQALTVLGTYVEQLESRAKERAVVAKRLVAFETLMAEFFGDKKVTIHPREGLTIERSPGGLLGPPVPIIRETASLGRLV